MPTHTQPKPQPQPPTTFLPSLGCLAAFSSSQLTKTLQNIQDLYFPQVPSLAGTGFVPQNPSHLHPNRLVQDNVDVPDSGYASAEEDEDDKEITQVASKDTENVNEIDVLRSDPLERAYTIKWLTSFIAHFVTLSHSENLIDIASALLSSLSAPSQEESESLTRTFTFPHPTKGEIKVQLNDAPLLSTDHTSVGLQSWASSVVLADRLSSNPPAFGLGTNLRVLELGAGTGLLSIVISLLIPSSSATIIATDFHPFVLSNLRTNVCSNASESLTVEVRHLDWSDPNYHDAGQPFDVIVAADVIYEKEHAGWIRNCVERLLVKPPLSVNGDDARNRRKGGTFWLIIPVRTTGRHEMMGGSVEVVFPDACDVVRGLSDEGVTDDVKSRWTLAIIHREDIERQGRIGRADEGGYRLFGIGWVSSG